MKLAERLTVELWDVRWEGDGFGKHGDGPFATERQALRCLHAVGMPGTVELVRFTMDREDFNRVMRRAPPRS